MELAPKPELNVHVGGFLLKQRFDLNPGRYRWTHHAGSIVGAAGLVTAGLTLAAQPWTAKANALAWVPMAIASALLLISADLMLKPKPPWTRFRDTGVVLSGWLAFAGVVIFSVLTANSLAWPSLFPLLVFPLALPAFGYLGVAPFSRIRMNDLIWSRLIAIGVLTSITLIAVALIPYQHQIAAQWAR